MGPPPALAGNRNLEWTCPEIERSANKWQPQIKQMPKIEHQPPTITCKHMCMLRVRRIGASAAGMLRSRGCPPRPWLPTGEARMAPGRPARPGGWQTRAAAARVRMCMCACIIWHCDRIAHARNRAAATAAQFPQPPPWARARRPGVRARKEEGHAFPPPG